MIFFIEEKVWKYNGEKASWYFVTIPLDISSKIKNNYKKKGFGSVKVIAKINQIQWVTSIFPYQKKTYILPIKKEIRDRLSVEENDFISASIQIIS